MRSPGTRMRGRGRYVRLLAVCAASVPLMLPTAASAAKYNVGAGAVTGTIVFDPPGIPSGGCIPNLPFRIQNASATLFAMNTVITGFVGQVSVTGSGVSVTCAGASAAGELSLTMSGLGPTGSRIDCGPLTGTFTRVGVQAVIQITGPCVVNAFGTGNVTFVSTVAFRPPPGAVTGEPILSSEFYGTFVVAPAQG